MDNRQDWDSFFFSAATDAVAKTKEALTRSVGTGIQLKASLPSADIDYPEDTHISLLPRDVSDRCLEVIKEGYVKAVQDTPTSYAHFRSLAAFVQTHNLEPSSAKVSSILTKFTSNKRNV